MPYLNVAPVAELKESGFLSCPQRRMKSTTITVTVGKTSSSRPQTDASSTPFTPTTPKTSTPNQKPEKPEKPSYISEFTNPATDPGNIVHELAIFGSL